MKGQLLLIAVSALIVGIGADARAELQNITAEIPRPRDEATFSSTASEFGRADSGDSSARASIGVSASTWAPKLLELPSRLAGASAAERTGLPGVLLTYETAPWSRLRVLGLAARFGLGLTSLQRTGPEFAAGEPHEVRQSIFLLSWRETALIRPSFLHWRALALHGGMSLLPTLVLTNASAFDESGTRWGMHFEASAGASTRLDSWSGSLPELSLELEGFSVFGKRQGMNFAGNGLRAGLRYPF